MSCAQTLEGISSAPHSAQHLCQPLCLRCCQGVLQTSGAYSGRCAWTCCMFWLVTSSLIRTWSGASQGGWFDSTDVTAVLVTDRARHRPRVGGVGRGVCARRRTLIRTFRDASQGHFLCSAVATAVLDRQGPASATSRRPRVDGVGRGICARRRTLIRTFRDASQGYVLCSAVVTAVLDRQGPALATSRRCGAWRLRPAAAARPAPATTARCACGRAGATAGSRAGARSRAWLASMSAPCSRLTGAPAASPLVGTEGADACCCSCSMVAYSGQSGALSSAHVQAAPRSAPSRPGANEAVTGSSLVYVFASRSKAVLLQSASLPECASQVSTPCSGRCLFRLRVS